MRYSPVIAVGCLMLGACGSEPQTAAPDAVVQAEPAVVAAPAARPVTVALTSADLRRVCVAGMAAVHGQAVDAAGHEGQTADAIRLDGVQEGVVAVSWPAPVDGGRRFAECRVEEGRILWRPTGLPTGQTATWMTGADDPVIRYALNGDQIAITQTFPDNTTSTSVLSVPTEEEAS